MLSYLPDVHQLLGVAGLAATLVLFLALGSAATPKGSLPEIRLAAGWGIACLVFTAWGVLTVWPMRLPAAVLAIAATIWLARPGCRERIGTWTPFGRILLLTLPLWLLMLSVWPSQIDTWLNLLPNAAYLFDHDALPTAQGPPSYSFLPLAPYNTQFATYLASVASGGFADGAMGLFNIALLCGASLLLARAASATEGTPPLWACALGLLLVAPLNPGFVPRFFLSPYGEPALAVMTLFAVWLAAEMLGDLARGIAWPKATRALALVLVALVNIKQSGIGLLLPIGASTLVLAVSDATTRRGRALVVVAVAFSPAVLVYLLWRIFVLDSGFSAGELQPLPFSEWNWALLPGIMLGVLRAMFHTATLFMLAAVMLVLAAVRVRRNPSSQDSRLLALIAGVVLLFNGFLLFTYVAHFPAAIALSAHSFFRYNTQVSLLVMLGLVVELRSWVAAWVAANPRHARYGAVAVVALILLLPIAAVRLLRFDRDTPQPELWRLGHEVAGYLHPGDRVALVLPNDTNDSVGSLLRGVLLFTPPRRPGLDFRMDTSADPAALSAAASAGYRLALVTCMSDGTVALLQYTLGGWRGLQSWSWPPSLSHQRFAAMLARGPLCGEP